jgi:hypothetical protein
MPVVYSLFAFFCFFSSLNIVDSALKPGGKLPEPSDNQQDPFPLMAPVCGCCEWCEHTQEDVVKSNGGLLQNGADICVVP